MGNPTGGGTNGGTTGIPPNPGDPTGTDPNGLSSSTDPDQAALDAAYAAANQTYADAQEIAKLDYTKSSLVAGVMQTVGLLSASANQDNSVADAENAFFATASGMDPKLALTAGASDSNLAAADAAMQPQIDAANSALSAAEQQAFESDSGPVAQGVADAYNATVATAETKWVGDANKAEQDWINQVNAAVTECVSIATPAETKFKGIIDQARQELQSTKQSNQTSMRDALGALAASIPMPMSPADSAYFTAQFMKLTTAAATANAEAELKAVTTVGDAGVAYTKISETAWGVMWATVAASDATFTTAIADDDAKAQVAEDDAGAAFISRLYGLEAAYESAIARAEADQGVAIDNARLNEAQGLVQSGDVQAQADDGSPVDSTSLSAETTLANTEWTAWSQFISDSSTAGAAYASAMGQADAKVRDDGAKAQAALTGASASANARWDSAKAGEATDAAIASAIATRDAAIASAAQRIQNIQSSNLAWADPTIDPAEMANVAGLWLGPKAAIDQDANNLRARAAEIIDDPANVLAFNQQAAPAADGLPGNPGAGGAAGAKADVRTPIKTISGKALIGSDAVTTHTTAGDIMIQMFPNSATLEHTQKPKYAGLLANIKFAPNPKDPTVAGTKYIDLSVTRLPLRGEGSFVGVEVFLFLLNTIAYEFLPVAIQVERA